MSYNENKFSAMLFSLTICIIILNTFNVVSIDINIILGIALLIYSIPTIYTAMENGKRVQIIISAFAFFTGLILLLIKWYEILNPFKIVFPSLLFIIGTIFLLLYIENTKVKAFLYAGIPAAALGIIAILFYRDLPFIYYADRIVIFISGYWHVLLIGAGIALLVNRKKR